MRAISCLVSMFIVCAAIGCGAKDDGKDKASDGQAATKDGSGKKGSPDDHKGGATTGETDKNALPSDPNSIALASDNTTVTFTAAKADDKQQGGFKTVAGNIELKDSKPTAIDVTIETNSLFADDEELANQLKSDDFFEVSSFPKVSLMSSKIEPVGDGDATHNLTAELTVRGVTKEVTIPMKVESSSETFALTTEFTISGKEFGFAAKSDSIDDAITIQIKVDASRK